MKKSSTILFVALAFIGGGILAFTIAGKGQINNIIKTGREFNLPVIVASSENLVTREYSLSGFTGIETSLTCSMDVRQGDTYSITLQLPENVADKVEVQEDRGILTIKPSADFWLRNNIIHAAITMPELTGLDLSGAAEVDFTGFSGKDLKIETSGAAKIRGGNGTYDTVVLNSSGAATVDFETLATVNARIDLSGAGRVVLNMAGGDLTGSLSGAGQVLYSGEVTRQNVETSGVGQVKQR